MNPTSNRHSSVARYSYHISVILFSLSRRTFRMQHIYRAVNKNVSQTLASCFGSHTFLTKRTDLGHIINHYSSTAAVFNKSSSSEYKSNFCWTRLIYSKRILSPVFFRVGKKVDHSYLAMIVGYQIISCNTSADNKYFL